ncbi:MAG TPA: translation elongation factor Ts [Bacteroidia bacterium]|nr:translation elongation factor Ts [Bacteroidia bacterium]
MTATITAADVNKLRTMTGAGMMDCKKALTETNGDFDAAIDLLRKKGQKVAANRSDRDAKEGQVVAKTNGGRGVVIVLNCETDFVAKNDDFAKVADTFAQIALDKAPADLAALLALPFESTTIGEKVIDLVGKIGEKIELSRYEQISAAKVVAYNHPGNKLACIVGFNKEASDDMAKDVAMQVAAMAPVAVDKDDVDTTTLERELDIAREQVRAEGKAEDMVEKIAQGKLNKFYKESTLLNQEFIKDSKKSIRQYLQGSDKELTVTGFKRIALG